MGTIDLGRFAILWPVEEEDEEEGDRPRKEGERLLWFMTVGFVHGWSRQDLDRTLLVRFLADVATPKSECQNP